MILNHNLCAAQAREREQRDVDGLRHAVHLTRILVAHTAVVSIQKAIDGRLLILEADAKDVEENVDGGRFRLDNVHPSLLRLKIEVDLERLELVRRDRVVLGHDGREYKDEQPWRQARP